MKQDLLSLIDVLQHKAPVVSFGCCFMRRMIVLSSMASELHHHLRLNLDFRSDLQYWALFAPQWNSSSLLYTALRDMPQVTVWSAPLKLGFKVSGWNCGCR